MTIDAFMAEIINALPDAIATALVTVLLAGGILYVFQKQIENSFARSLFQYQTKFSTNFSKSVETLENLYKKYVAFNETLEEMISARAAEESGWEQKHEKATELLKDFKSYYQDNRLYLPGALADHVSTVYIAAQWVSTAIYAELLFAKPNNTDLRNWTSDELRSLVTHNEIKLFDDKTESVLKDMRGELYKQVKFLENIYKSIAEAK